MAVLFFIVLAFMANSAFAKPISQSEAQNIATNLAKTKKHSTMLKTKKIRKSQPTMERMNFAIEENMLYYVFDIGENNGFAIIAGDDVFKPVLGISENGKFDYADMPPNFAWYLQNLEAELEYALQNGQTANSETIKEWELYAASAPYITGTYLIKTTWSQESPYNNMCPKIAGIATYTGCVATSMSQLMNYHQWPLQISGGIPQYTTQTSAISVPAISRENFAYDWANMANSYSGTTTSAQKTAVATIMHHSGAAIKMDYDTDGSGAYSTNIPKVMPLYFDYDRNIKFISRDGKYIRPEDYTEIASGTWRPSNDSILPYIWEDIMKIQIDSLLPVIYSGNPENGGAGHSFILDGYDNSGKFHFNWGWGGQYDGWFASTVLKPGTGRDYSYSQDAIINIMPNLQEAGNSDLRIFGKNLLLQNYSVARGEIFKVNATIYNIGTATFPRGKTLGIAILNPLNEEVFEIIGTVVLDSIMPFNRAREITSASYLRGDYSLDIESVIFQNISPGNYILKAAIKNENDVWEFIEAATSYLNSANITVNDEVIPDNSYLELCRVITLTPVERALLYDYVILQGNPLEANIGIRNTGTSAFIGKISVELGDEKIGESFIIIPVGSTCRTITLNSKNIVSGDGEYILSIVAENVAEEKSLVASYNSYYKNPILVYVWDSGSCPLANRCGDGCVENFLVEYCDDGQIKTPIRLPQLATANQAIQIHNGINLQTTNSATVEIYSLKGNLISKQNFASGVYSVSLGNLPKGMYIVKISFANSATGANSILRVPVM